MTTIIHKFDATGGFMAADTATGRSAYAFPTSPYATQANRNPVGIAAEMMKAENAGGAWRDAEHHRTRDARNIAFIQGA